MKFREKRERKVRPNVDLTPLIDVVFQLLIFFMLSATFVVQSSIQVEMPTAEGAVELEHKDLSITLVYEEGAAPGEGPIYVDSVLVASYEELSGILAEKKVESPDVQVLVFIDERRRSGDLITVFGIAKSVGLANVGVGANPPKDEQ
jgi:biopolymer transport protein ExbD